MSQEVDGAEPRPHVSVLVVCRNEQRYIEECVLSLMRNGYPEELLEILVIDGESEDGTRQVVERMREAHPAVRLLSNPGRITASGLNVGIRSASHGVIMWVGAHARYDPGYIETCVRGLGSGAWNVGGVLRTVPRTSGLMPDLIAIVLTHPFGVGNARFRMPPSEPMWVDTVFGGCFPRFVFDRVGLFNERLVRGQDMEFSIRLRRTGGRILLMPKAVCSYFARSTLRDFVRHNLSNGVWAILPFVYSSVVPVRARHLVPLAFAGSLLLGVLLALAGIPGMGVAIVVELAAYLGFAFAASILVARRRRRPVLAVSLPWMFLLLHLTYGIGSLVGLVRATGILLRRLGGGAARSEASA